MSKAIKEPQAGWDDFVVKEQNQLFDRTVNKVQIDKKRNKKGLSAISNHIGNIKSDYSDFSDKESFPINLGNQAPDTVDVSTNLLVEINNSLLEGL
jgi:hypothetical protein